MVGVKGKRDYEKPAHDEALREKVNAFAKQKYMKFQKLNWTRHDRSDRFAAIERWTDGTCQSWLECSWRWRIAWSETKKLVSDLLWRSAILCGSGYDPGWKSSFGWQRILKIVRRIGYGSRYIAFTAWCRIIYKRRNSITYYSYFRNSIRWIIGRKCS